jgi:hypothetical protein
MEVRSRCLDIVTVATSSEKRCVVPCPHFLSGGEVLLRSLTTTCSGKALSAFSSVTGNAGQVPRNSVIGSPCPPRDRPSTVDDGVEQAGEAAVEVVAAQGEVQITAFPALGDEPAAAQDGPVVAGRALGDVGQELLARHLAAGGQGPHDPQPQGVVQGREHRLDPDRRQGRFLGRLHEVTVRHSSNCCDGSHVELPSNTPYCSNQFELKGRVPDDR